MKRLRWLACLLPPVGLILAFAWEGLSRGDALGVGQLIGLSPVILAIGAVATGAAILLVRVAFWLARTESRLGFAVVALAVEMGPLIGFSRPQGTEVVQMAFVGAVVLLAAWTIGPAARAPSKDPDSEGAGQGSEADLRNTR